MSFLHLKLSKALIRFHTFNLEEHHLIPLREELRDREVVESCSWLIDASVRYDQP